MAKYGKNNYFDGVILPEPKEEMLRRMAKGVNTTRGYLYARSIDIDKYNGDRSFQVAFTTGDDITTTQYIRTNCPLGLVISNDRMYVSMWGQWLLGYDVQSNTEYDVVVSFDVTTRASTLYVNGQLIATRLREDVAPNYSKTYFLGAYPEQTNLFTGDIALCREFNFQIPKAVVALLHNNGDPAGYKLPSNYKGYGDVYHSDFSEGADDWHVVLTDYVTMTVADGVITISKEDERRNMNIARNHNPYASRVVNYFVRLEFAEPLPSEVGNIAARPFNSIVGVNLVISSDRLSASGTLISTIAKPNGGSMIIFQALGAISISISSISFTPAVCIAEYLPHNLIPTAEGSVVKWLDSAPQLPEANGILPPLDASVGGYDLAAIGNPKIII